MIILHHPTVCATPIGEGASIKIRLQFLAGEDPVWSKDVDTLHEAIQTIIQMVGSLPRETSAPDGIHKWYHSGILTFSQGDPYILPALAAFEAFYKPELMLVRPKGRYAIVDVDVYPSVPLQFIYTISHKLIKLSKQKEETYEEV